MKKKYFHDSAVDRQVFQAHRFGGKLLVKIDLILPLKCENILRMYLIKSSNTENICGVSMWAIQKNNVKIDFV